jgi:Mce-associated membrane protein
MDDETVITTEPAPAAAPSASSARAGWLLGRSTHILILIAILVAAVLAESVLVLRGGGTDQVRADVRGTAYRFAGLLTTYNASTIGKQRREVLALATGKFRSQYDELTGSSFVATLKETQADSKGHVVRIAVSDVTGDNATVLAVVQTTTTNKNLKAPRIESNLLELSLVKTAAGWRIDNVTILGALT